jgi:hypothetical protein
MRKTQPGPLASFYGDGTAATSLKSNYTSVLSASFFGFVATFTIFHAAVAADFSLSASRKGRTARIAGSVGQIRTMASTGKTSSPSPLVTG